MTQETDASEQAQQLREMADKIDDPYYREGHTEGAKLQGAAVYQALKGSLGRREQDQLEDIVRQNPNLTWPETLDHYYSLRARGGGTTPASATRQPSSSQFRTPAPAISIDEADRLYALPANHPDKLSHEDYKRLRAQHGVRS